MSQSTDPKPSHPAHHHRQDAPVAVLTAIVTVSDTRTLETDTGGLLVEVGRAEVQDERVGVPRHLRRFVGGWRHDRQRARQQGDVGDIVNSNVIGDVIDQRVTLPELFEKRRRLLSQRLVVHGSLFHSAS